MILRCPECNSNVCEDDAKLLTKNEAFACPTCSTRLYKPVYWRRTNESKMRTA